MSQQRFGNYFHGKRVPDTASLQKIAEALDVSINWLIGAGEASASARSAIVPVLLRLLELEGIQRAKAEAIAIAAEEALRLLASLPGDGDDQTRGLLAAQAAWNARRLTTTQ